MKWPVIHWFQPSPVMDDDEKRALQLRVALIVREVQMLQRAAKEHEG